MNASFGEGEEQLSLFRLWYLGHLQGKLTLAASDYLSELVLPELYSDSVVRCARVDLAEYNLCVG